MKSKKSVRSVSVDIEIIFPLLSSFGFAVDLLEVRRLPAQARPVVDELDGDLVDRFVDEDHGWIAYLMRVA